MVISHLALAAFYFAVGVLTRNAKIVYGLGVAFYPLYIAYQHRLSKEPACKVANNLDPLVMNWNNVHSERRDAAFVNHMAVVYDSDLIVNRVTMLDDCGPFAHHSVLLVQNFGTLNRRQRIFRC